MKTRSQFGSAWMARLEHKAHDKKVLKKENLYYHFGCSGESLLYSSVKRGEQKSVQLDHDRQQHSQQIV